MQSSLVTCNIALILLQNKVFNTWNSLIQNLVFQKFAIMLGICKSGQISEISNISCVVWFHEGTGEILLNFSWQYALTNLVNSSKNSPVFLQINESITNWTAHCNIYHVHTHLHHCIRPYLALSWVKFHILQYLQSTNIVLWINLTHLITLTCIIIFISKMVQTYCH